MSDLNAILAIFATLGASALLLAPKDDPAVQIATAPSPSAMVSVADGDPNGRWCDVTLHSIDGAFYLDGTVQRAKVRFLVDTGASKITLSRSDAKRANVQGDAGSVAQTLAGPQPVAVGFAQTIAVAGNVWRDVPVVIQRGTGSVSLLGLDALTKIGSVTFNGDTMNIRSKRSCVMT